MESYKSKYYKSKLYKEITPHIILEVSWPHSIRIGSGGSYNINPESTLFDGYRAFIAPMFANNWTIKNRIRMYNFFKILRCTIDFYPDANFDDYSSFGYTFRTVDNEVTDYTELNIVWPFQWVCLKEGKAQMSFDFSEIPDVPYGDFMSTIDWFSSSPSFPGYFQLYSYNLNPGSLVTPMRWVGCAVYNYYLELKDLAY